MASTKRGIDIIRHMVPCRQVATSESDPDPLVGCVVIDPGPPVIEFRFPQSVRLYEPSFLARIRT